jgi:hypothetical protein
MRLRIICGNDDCRQEYTTDTMDRTWECPHCGRVRENDFYPFLTARMMQARINGKDEDWEVVHDDMVEKADVRVQEKNVRLRRLEGDLEVPDDKVHPDAIAEMNALIKEDEGRTDLKWRERSEWFMGRARKIILAIEDRVQELEEERKTSKGG